MDKIEAQEHFLALLEESLAYIEEKKPPNAFPDFASDYIGITFMAGGGREIEVPGDMVEDVLRGAVERIKSKRSLESI